MLIPVVALLLPLAAGCANASSVAAGAAVTQTTTAKAAGITSPTPTRGPVPAEFARACGHPGSTVIVIKVPVVVRHKDCDLTGVIIRIGADGAGSVVPDPGGSSTAVVDVAAGSRPPPAELDLAVDADTSDVTVDETGPGTVTNPG